MTVTETAKEGTALALAKELRSAGDLSAECASAFETVRREQFVPDKIWVRPDYAEPHVPVDRVNEPEKWLSYVYSDRVLVTQFDDGATKWPDVGRRPTSSASMPSVVAGMLTSLAPESDDSVLEIGTGTGFNAALLAEMVGGDGNVTTIEIEEKIASAARRNLDRAGCRWVNVDVADASTKVFDDKFDCVIATAGVHVGQLPYSWVACTRPGGTILAPMRADLASGPLVKFEVGDDGTARGRAVRMRVGFMELRSHRVRSLPLAELPSVNAGFISNSRINPFDALSNEDSRWALAVALPSCRYEIEEVTQYRRHEIAWLMDPMSESWACVAPCSEDMYTVRQFGPRRLWDEAVRALDWWKRKGEPPIEAWTWTVDNGRQTVTLR